jgi:hypothetical protein
MKKIVKIFFDIKKELEWLSQQKGIKLVHTNGIRYTFDESNCDYNYEYVYFKKSKKELHQIMNQIQDDDIEFVCNSSSWALFRKDAAKGAIHVLEDNYIIYRILMRRYNTYLALGACYIGLGSTQSVLASAQTLLKNASWIDLIFSGMFYFCSVMFFLSAIYYRKSAKIYDDGTYAMKMKRNK